MEDALQDAVDSGDVTLPVITVDFSESDLGGLLLTKCHSGQPLSLTQKLPRRAAAVY